MFFWRKKREEKLQEVIREENEKRKKKMEELQIELEREKDKEGFRLVWSYETKVISIAIEDGYIAVGSYDDNIYCFDYSGKLLWSYRTGGGVRSVAIEDGYIAVGSYDDNIYCFDYSGKLLWSYKTGGNVWSVAIEDGYVVAGSGDSNIYCFDYSGKLLWSYETSGDVWSVAIEDGYVVAGSLDGKIYCFDYSGKLLWSYRTGGGGVRSVAIEDGYVVAGSDDSNVYCFDYSGKLLWSYRTGNHVLSIAIEDGYIAAGSYDGKIYCFDYSGKLLWSYRTDSWVESVAIGDRYVVAGIKDSKVYCFDYSGKLLWSYETGGWVGSIAIKDGYIVGGSSNNKLYVFFSLQLLKHQLETLQWKLQSKIEEAKQKGIIIPETKAFDYFNQGKYSEALTQAKKELREITELMEKYETAKQLINDFERELERYSALAINETNITKLLEETKSSFNKGEYANSIEKINKAREVLNKIVSKSNPILAINLTQTEFKLNAWRKTTIEVVNKGNAIAKSIHLSFFGDVEVKNPPAIKQIMPGNKEVVEVALKPMVEGEVPVDVKVTYRNHRNEERSVKETVWINVYETAPTKQAQPAITPVEFKPMPTTPKTFPPELSESYEEVKYIGKGGFARVFKAKRKNGKIVAVKIPISLDPATGKSFIKELTNWTKLEHPNIVEVHDYNILPIPYFEMELCDFSLADIKKPVEPEKAAWLVFNICEGLKYTHSRNIIHRDLKPQNIMLKDGIPKISDWGLSKVIAESTSATTAMFTPLYAAPEQISRKFGKPDVRTDVWQLGVIFYELVTGELPFNGDDAVEIMSAITMDEPVQPSVINPEAKDVESIILKCLEKEQEKRYQSVEELQKDLAKYLQLRYSRSLKESLTARNVKRSAYYCSELMLLNLKINEPAQAYKYATDLLKYAEGEVKDVLRDLCSQLKIRVEEGIYEIPEELVKKAEFIAHKIRLDFREVFG